MEIPCDVDVDFVKYVVTPSELKREPDHHSNQEIDQVARDPLSEVGEGQAIEGMRPRGLVCVVEASALLGRFPHEEHSSLTPESATCARGQSPDSLKAERPREMDARPEAEWR